MRSPSPSAVAVLVVLVLIGCGGEPPPAAGKRGRGGSSFPVTVETVAPSRIDLVVAANGAIEAAEQISIVARVAGTVESVAFREGDAVAPETTLVAIDPQRFRLARDSAAATRDAAAASLAEAEQGLARRERLGSDDRVQAEELAAWRTRVQSARAQLAKAEADLGLAEVNLRDAQVRPPIAGVIQTRTVATGTWVAAGTVLATLVRRDPLMLRMAVTAEDAARLRPGMIARFATAGGAEGAAELAFIAAATDASAARMIDLRARVTEGGDAVVPGVFASVRILVGDRSSPVVPESAVRSTDRGYVAVKVEAGEGGPVARLVPVRIGLRTGDGRIEVLSGLAPGDQVVVGGVEAIGNGTRLEIRGPATAPALAAGGGPATRGHGGRRGEGAASAGARP